ncbi:Pfu1 protein [Saccharomycopsis crataegensis]|uniref:Pfu1 protein n=1 Tax=Saccharomycopsis crataegensis TaxID=43959 RepID=A0AAV5QUR3_9ASCO|nr:Pfu1 protein [Saccharomycopsis crataegensis]
MANKRRPKKYKVPFKKYGPNGIISTKLSANDFKQKEQQEREQERDSGYYNYSSKNAKDDEDMFYTYSYGDSKKSSEEDYYGKGETMTNKDGNTAGKQQLEINRDLPMKLPAELCELVLQFLSYPDGLNLKFFLVSKLWYVLCLKILYEKPVLNPLNFNKFVDSMTNPSIVSYVNLLYTSKFFQYGDNNSTNMNTITTNSTSMKRQLKYSKTPLVKTLDLRNIVQAGKNSNITKILRRCSSSLSELSAPQTSFGLTSLNILKMCHHLVTLDLSLVSETVNLLDLLNSIKELNQLKVLKFPRSSINCNLNSSSVFSEIKDHEITFEWPKNLEQLKLSGGITNEFLMDLNFPANLTSLEFQHCPLIKDYSIYYLLGKVGFNLKHLSIIYPMPNLKDNSLDLMFKYCPFIESLEIFVDYISQWSFSEINFPWIINSRHIPNYQFNSNRENVLIDGGKRAAGYGYGVGKNELAKRNYLIDAEDYDISLRNIIISTTQNYFEEEDDEDENQEDSDDASPVKDADGTDGNNKRRKINYKELGLESLRPLKSIYLGSSGTLGQSNKIHPDDLLIALAEQRLPYLKTLQISNRVGWSVRDESMSQLVDLFDSHGGNIYMCP